MTTFNSTKKGVKIYIEKVFKISYRESQGERPHTGESSLQFVQNSVDSLLKNVCMIHCCRFLALPMSALFEHAVSGLGVTPEYTLTLNEQETL